METLKKGQKKKKQEASKSKFIMHIIFLKNYHRLGQ